MYSTSFWTLTEHNLIFATLLYGHEGNFLQEFLFYDRICTRFLSFNLEFPWFFVFEKVKKFVLFIYFSEFLPQRNIVHASHATKLHRYAIHFCNVTSIL